MFDFWTGSETLPVSGFLIRAVIIYIYMFLIVKVLGQRSIGTVQPIDFIFGVIIGDVLGEPLAAGETPLAGPIAAAATISAFHLSLSYIALKTPRFRRIIEDEPLIIIKNGRILEKEMKKAKLTVESLLTDLRIMGASDLKEVDYAVLESNGQISVIKKSEFQALTPNDMQKKPAPKGYPTVLIQDGQIIDANLQKVGTIGWLDEQVRKLGCRNHTEVFLLTMDEGGQIYMSKK